jgi:5-(carboxyamino)imidazole ribonucleotide mutase
MLTHFKSFFNHEYLLYSYFYYYFLFEIRQPSGLARLAPISIMRRFQPPFLAGKGVTVMLDMPVVGIVMGSQSDWSTMRHTAETLEALGVAHEAKIISAHRTPDRMADYAKSAKKRGLKVIIAGAGGAAHLPGMVAAMTTLPVFGVPVESKTLKGMDSLLSIVQMPGGVPVGTLAIGKAGAINAALLAASVVALGDTAVEAALTEWRRRQTDSVALAPEDEND